MEKTEPIRYENGRPMLLGGLRRHHPFAESGSGIPGQWQQLKNLLPLPKQLSTTTYGVMCGSNSDSFEYLCGVEVESFSGLSGDIERLRILEQHYAIFLHANHVSTIQTTWNTIYKEWLPSSIYESAHKPDFEVYDKRFDTNTGLGGIEVWVAVTLKIITRNKKS